MSNPSNEIRHQSRPRTVTASLDPPLSCDLWIPLFRHIWTSTPSSRYWALMAPARVVRDTFTPLIMLHEMDRVPHKKYISRKPRPRKFIITFWQLSCKLKGPDGSSLWLCEKVGCWMLPNTVCVISPHKEIVLARARWGYNELSSGAAALPTPVPFIFCWFPPWPDLPHLDWKFYFHFWRKIITTWWSLSKSFVFMQSSLRLMICDIILNLSGEWCFYESFNSTRLVN